MTRKKNILYFILLGVGTILLFWLCVFIWVDILTSTKVDEAQQEVRTQTPHNPIKKIAGNCYEDIPYTRLYVDDTLAVDSSQLWVVSGRNGCYTIEFYDMYYNGHDSCKYIFPEEITKNCTKTCELRKCNKKLSFYKLDGHKEILELEIDE